MSLLSLVSEMGDDADLLTRSDEWLETERVACATELDRAANELRLIMLAQRIKIMLQQRNLVAYQELIRDDENRVVDINIKLVNLPEIISVMAIAKTDILDQLNVEAQLTGWKQDGYDLNVATKTRS